MGASLKEAAGKERDKVNPSAFKINLAMDDDEITINWVRLPQAGDPLSNATPYRELQFSFKYTDISKDTVQAMLRDMAVPDALSKAIMTRILARAT